MCAPLQFAQVGGLVASFGAFAGAVCLRIIRSGKNYHSFLKRDRIFYMSDIEKGQFS